MTRHRKHTDTHTLLWIILLIVAGGSITALLIYFRVLAISLSTRLSTVQKAGRITIIDRDQTTGKVIDIIEKPFDGDQVTTTDGGTA